MRESVDVIPWAGAPVTVLTCGHSVSFSPGSNDAPQLPWTITVRNQAGQTLLRRDLSPGAGPKQIYVTAQGAELVDAGGSHGAPAIDC
jgi:hypothetical protein